MMIGRILLAGLSLALPAQSARPVQQSVCARALAAASTDGAAAEICAGEEAARLANVAPKESAGTARQWEAAADHYRKAATVASAPATKVLALNLLVGVFDAQHLNDGARMEAALRDLITQTPDDLAPVFRLARLQEDHGFIDTAEDTLLGARHRQPDAVEPNRMLAQFYARLVAASHREESRAETQAASNSGEPDEQGVYGVGSSIARPGRDLSGHRSLLRHFDFDDDPTYPPEAVAAGIEGAVVAEVVIDASGDVTQARVVRSIPLLDEAALQAVRNWHYAPTVVKGQAVPVRMNVTVNFVPPLAPPTSQPRQ